ncbi:MAG: discoidin domain-containing protein [Acidobacteriia bacterium]|nr:discoidin domain-containing protein [Terriglobia bacterium]
MIRTLAAVLFGACFTVATAWALGALLLRRCSISLDRWEERLLAFVLGSASLSAIVFLLCAVRLVHPGVLLAVGLAGIGYAVRSGAHRSRGQDFPPLPPLWRWTFVVIFGGFALLYFLNALAPEMSPDGMAYHLGVVAKYQRAHGFIRITDNLHASLSEGAELLFLYAFEFGKHSAAALVHFALWIALAGMILCYGRRIAHPAAGVAGAIFTAVSPLVAFDGSVAYIDVAVAAVLFALFYLLQIWDQDWNPRLLALIGMLAGFGYAVKYTAILAVPYALGFVGWKMWRARRPILRPALTISAVALAFILPWMAKNWIEVRNPIAPFASGIFPNPYEHVSEEYSWRQWLKTYDLASYMEIPFQVTVQGNKLAGFLGPLFLMTPLALLSLRLPAGRQLLLAGGIFTLTYFSNIGARFLIPVVPYVALSLALAFTELPWLLLLLIVAHSVTSLPRVYVRYTPGSWSLNKVSLGAAVRKLPSDTYLSHESEEYNTARLVERLVPPGQRTFTFSPTAESYTQRDMLVGWQSAYGEVLQDILWTPMTADMAPTRFLRFQFPARALRRIRVIQTAAARDVQWSVSELRVFAGSGEVPRAPAWRLTAHPNPWEVQLAFDNSPVTRWRSWQDAEPGMYLDVDFGRAQTVDAVVVETSGDARAAKIKLDAMTPDGKWTTISEQPYEIERASRANLRRAATSELKARGIRYLLIRDDDHGARDFSVYANQWGITNIGRWNNRRLYRID